jgi:hypothetical protein
MQRRFFPLLSTPRDLAVGALTRSSLNARNASAASSPPEYQARVGVFLQALAL